MTETITEGKKEGRKTSTSEKWDGKREDNILRKTRSKDVFETDLNQSTIKEKGEEREERQESRRKR